MTEYRSNGLTYITQRSAEGFYGFTYQVRDAGYVNIGTVRVEYRAGQKGRGSKGWVPGGAWEALRAGSDGYGWIGHFDTRREAAGYLSQLPRPSRQPKPEVKPEPEPEEPESYPGYPVTRYCPEGHGSHEFNSPITKELVRDCPECGERLVETKPEPKSDLQGLPELPALRHDALPRIVSALQAGRHVYLAGAPGTGKSELARQAAEALSLSFGMIACDSSMTRSTLMGFTDAGGQYHRTPLREAVENGGVFLLDEIDNGNPSLLAALNSAMSNGHVAFPDATVEVSPDFRVVATANTWGGGPTAEFVGRLRVDPATLDRFVRVHVDIDERLERNLTVLEAGGDEELADSTIAAVRAVRRRVEDEGLRIVVSPRAAMQVAALRLRGWSLRDAMMTTALGTLEERRATDLMGGAM